MVASFPREVEAPQLKQIGNLDHGPLHSPPGVILLLNETRLYQPFPSYTELKLKKKYHDNDKRDQDVLVFLIRISTILCCIVQVYMHSGEC